LKENLAQRSTSLTWAGVETAAAGLILGYGALANGVIPAALYVPANLVAAGAAIYLAGRVGVTLKEMGLERARLASGLRLGLVCIAPIAAIVAIGVAVPWSRHYFLDSEVTGASTGRALYDMLVRIPFGTALAEELLFRGALLGLYLQRHRPWVAVALSSGVFGVWHVLPTLHSLTTNAAASDAVGSGSIAKAGAVAGVVAVTALAGAAFSWLRLRSGSVVAPWIAHTALNSLSFLGGRIGMRLNQ
jgi:membrane protease YdiL (CAAX protease family)